jgi:hypothetical protein
VWDRTELYSSRSTEHYSNGHRLLFGRFVKNDRFYPVKLVIQVTFFSGRVFRFAQDCETMTTSTIIGEPRAEQDRKWTAKVGPRAFISRREHHGSRSSQKEQTTPTRTLHTHTHLIFYTHPENHTPTHPQSPSH